MYFDRIYDVLRHSLLLQNFRAYQGMALGIFAGGIIINVMQKTSQSVFFHILP
jgi:hypothetical protein